MKKEFKFDAKTGTMVADTNATSQPSTSGSLDGVTEKSIDSIQQKPEFEQEVQIASHTDKTIKSAPVIRMQRVDKLTPIQLTNADGIPEAYLDSEDVGILMFREREDYDLCQISDEKTGKVLGYIGGYALQFNFNMAELNSMEKIEQCLQGLVKLFRHKIMSQNLRSE